MKKVLLFIGTMFLLSTFAFAQGESVTHEKAELPQKRLVYIVSDLRIPFWDIMWRGIKSKGEELGYKVDIYSSSNNAKDELIHTANAIRSQVDGIVVSPTSSSACATILRLTNKANIPVVISDIGTDGGEYVSYISSDNYVGAYKLGSLLATHMQSIGWQDGTVGIIAIPQKRANGQARTAGFMKALTGAGIIGAGIRQQATFSYQETYSYTTEMIEEHPNMQAIWLQGSNQYQAALDAIKDTGKEGEIILITFDAEPEFMQLIPDAVLLGAGMQQPFLIGEEAVATLHDHLQGRAVEHNKKLPVLAISSKNIEGNRALIERNVLGIIEE